MKRLAGKVAIVTGASAGIGRATARLFASKARRSWWPRAAGPSSTRWSPKFTQKTARRSRSRGDVQSEDFAHSLVALAVSRFGRLDVAFNNAGIIGESGPTTDISEKGWSEALAINLTSAFLGAKHQIPQMLRQGAGRSSSPAPSSDTASPSRASPPMQQASRG